MHCPQCGNPINQQQKFCGSCGFNLTQMQQEQTQQIPPTVHKETPEVVSIQKSSQPQWSEVKTHTASSSEVHAQPVYQQPTQPPKKKGKGIFIVVAVVLLIAMAGFGAMKLKLIPNLMTDDISNTGSSATVANLRFVSEPSNPESTGRVFNSIASVTLLADLKNVKDVVDVEILWLYENEEILTDYLQYQAGDYIEYTIETADGAFFDAGSYSVVLYIDGIAVANGGFDVN